MGSGVGAAVAVMSISSGTRRSAGRLPARPVAGRKPGGPRVLVATAVTSAADAPQAAILLPTIQRRGRSALLEAARGGQFEAFRELCADLDDALLRAVRNTLREEQLEVTASRVRLLVNTVCARAFSELAEKPADWSLYGWMAWLIRLEVIEGCARLPAVRTADQGGRHGPRNS